MTDLSDARSPSYAELVEENRRLRARLEQVESAASTSAAAATTALRQPDVPQVAPASPWSHSLTSSQIDRYSRQLILSEFGGADTQRRLLGSSVLVVGAGGLGAPVALYLTAAGVGRIVIVDGDVVEASNLHRQVAHTESRIGHFKAESARAACLALNSGVRVEAVCERLTEANALSLVEGVDVVIDASDNVATRYLCNDAAITCGKPLVSGSALRLDGQVSVFGLHGGPCYRCLYPVPPPAATVTNCADGGVLGAVTGVIGSIQALETIKLLGGLVPHADQPPITPLAATSTDFSPAASAATHATLDSRLLLFDGSAAAFRTVRIRPRNRACVACGDAPTITRETMQSRAIDYQHFCAAANHDTPIGSREAAVVAARAKVPSASVEEYRRACDAAASASPSVVDASPSSSSPVPLLLDVREPVQFRICALPRAINVPLRVLKREIPAWLRHLLRTPVSVHTIDDANATVANTDTTHLVVQSTTPHPAIDSTDAFDSHPNLSCGPPRDIFVICRRGIDSVTATRLLLAAAQQSHDTACTIDTSATYAAADTTRIRNVTGGLQSWTERIDPTFPLY